MSTRDFSPSAASLKDRHFSCHIRNDFCRENGVLITKASAKSSRNSIISKGQTIFKAYIIEKHSGTIIIDQNGL